MLVTVLDDGTRGVLGRVRRAAAAADDATSVCRASKPKDIAEGRGSILLATKENEIQSAALDGHGC